MFSDILKAHHFQSVGPAPRHNGSTLSRQSRSDRVTRPRLSTRAWRTAEKKRRADTTTRKRYSSSTTTRSTTYSPARREGARAEVRARPARPPVACPARARPRFQSEVLSLFFLLGRGEKRTHQHLRALRFHLSRRLLSGRHGWLLTTSLFLSSYSSGVSRPRATVLSPRRSLAAASLKLSRPRPGFPPPSQSSVFVYPLTMSIIGWSNHFLFSDQLILCCFGKVSVQNPGRYHPGRNNTFPKLFSQ